MNKKSRIISTILIYLVMVIMAVTEGLINIFTVPLKNGFGINDTMLSIMFMCGSICYLICNYIGGMVCDKIGQKKLFLIGLIGAAITNIIQGIAPNFIVFIIAFAMIQGFLGIMAIAANTIIPILWITGQAIAMNLTHFAYGVGLSASQKLSGILITDGISWRTIYMGSAALTFIIFVCFMFVKLPRAEETENVDRIPLKTVLQDKLIWVFFLGLGFYVVAEQGTGRWLPTFIKTNYSSFTDSKIASYVSLFFLLFTIGRLVGGFIVEKIGSQVAIKAFSFIGGVLFIIGLLSGENGLYIVSISGFFFSIMFPTVVVVLSNTFKNSTAYITGVVISFANIINTIMNLVIGTASDAIGISKAIFIMPISMLIAFVLFCIASKIIKKRYN
ncbi:MAG: MFS transporter [Clostridium baratii]|uniref:Major Facilitator Superfamily protein n=1 Tax=Clostridium baratii str. Sullivan TaxID=1415775 RepID=A0A0A7FY82_9CLOT|nr:MFS transporter [Clostridium baratii]AIY83860.1 major Facilitator Superfamily protein [Clostridium baratii str. Sullivan]AQM61003.1 MFS transporter [Clostridium baratii]MBS6006773.1 MFS transporter [Clostridium baratii]MDU4910402.1 MFS transporter [Clostridium baratii]